jgi:hypothetical protein
MMRATRPDTAGAPRSPLWVTLVDSLTLALAALAAIISASGGIRKIIFDDLRISLTDPWRPLIAGVLVCAIRHLVFRRPTLWDRLRILWAWIERRAGRQPFAADDGVLLANTPSPVCRRGELLAVAALMALLTILMTYPQIRRLDSLADLGDPLFSLWRLSWVAHQLPRDPLHLFDGNMFYPERFTLAYSDSMLLPAVTAAPFLWLGAHTVVVYNLFLLTTFVLAGVSMYLLVRALTGQAPAALVAGVAFAFYPFRFEHYSHFELAFSFWMPLVLLALHRTLARGRMKEGLLTGALFAGQMFSCMYFGVFLLTYLVPVWIVLGIGWRRIRSSLVPFAAGVALAAVLIGPLAIPYVSGRQTVGQRTAGEVEFYSATGQSYLRAHPNRATYQQLSSPRQRQQERELFPGILIVVLAAIALWPPLSVSRMAYGVGLVVSFEASLGLHGLLYPLLYRWVPAYHGLRVPARFSMLVGLSLAILAGFGVARLSRPVRRNWRWALAALFVGVVLLESRAILPPFLHVNTEPNPIYAWFDGRPPSVLAEVPPGTAESLDVEFGYLYASTFHWQRLVNGSSGFQPPSYWTFLDAMAGFPDDRSMAFLRGRGVEYVAVHEQNYFWRQVYRRVVAEAAARADLREIRRADLGGDEARLYQVLR